MKRTLGTRALLAALAVVIAACGCSRPSESTDAKRSPKPPPAETVTIPAALHVDVEIDGAPAPAIDAARLTATKPDFSDEEHRAWRLATLLGTPATRPGVAFSAIGDKGLSLEMRPGAAPSDPAPALSLNRRGEVVVGLVAPDDPFPDFHGKGGRLNRPGDPLPRVSGPTKLRVYVAAAPPAASASSTVGTGTGGGNGDGGGAQSSSDATPLKVVVTGGAPTTWTPAALSAVQRFTIHADGADKDAWSLRDVVHQLVGPRARATSAVDGDGTRAKISPKDWADVKKTPVLRINRRGMYKIEWVDKDGNMTNDDDVRDVKTVEVVPQ
jgi:hypothetical protein